MKKRSARLWFAAVALLMLLAPAAVVWWVTGDFVSYPIERFLPARLSAAVCLRHPQQAWERHWTARRGPAPEDALKAVMIAVDEWPRWVKNYSEVGAILKLKFYQEAFLQAVGEESWLTFGEWDGQIGMVLFIRGDSAVRSRLTPFIDLLVGDYKIKRATCEGETIFIYEGKRRGRSLTFCQVGGWICISLRRTDGPLPAIIHQVKGGGAEERSAEGGARRTHSDAVEVDLGQMVRTSPMSAAAVSCAFRPQLFWSQLRLFTSQRGRSFSKVSRRQLATWERQLSGFDLLTLRQVGESIFDLELAATGPRLAELSKSLVTPASLPAIKNPQSAIRNPQSSHEIAQLEMALPFARLSGSLAGFTWEELLGQESQAMDLILPGLRTQLRAALDSKEGPAAGRIGLAAYAAPETLIPHLLLWVDRPPLKLSTQAPARTWLAEPRTTAVTAANGDQCLWLGQPPTIATPVAAAATDGRTWEVFTDRLWKRGAVAPLAFLTLDFNLLSNELKKVPTIVMKKKPRKQFEHWKSAIDTLALSAGGAAARLDPQGNRWILTLMTP